METIAAFILAGGASRRMGTDKSQLLLEGKSFLEHVAAALATAERPVRPSAFTPQCVERVRSSALCDPAGLAGSLRLRLRRCQRTMIAAGPPQLEVARSGVVDCD